MSRGRRSTVYQPNHTIIIGVEAVRQILKKGQVLPTLDLQGQELIYLFFEDEFSEISKPDVREVYLAAARSHQLGSVDKMVDQMREGLKDLRLLRISPTLARSIVEIVQGVNSREFAAFNRSHPDLRVVGPNGPEEAYVDFRNRWNW